MRRKRMRIIGESFGDEPRPEHQLTRIGETMLTALTKHGEFSPDMRAIVVLLGEHRDHGEDEPCGMPLGFCCSGYKGSTQLLEDMATALQVVAAAQGVHVEIQMSEAGRLN